MGEIKIGETSPDAIMYGSPLNKQKDSVFDWFKFANDDEGYYVRGLWLCPISPLGIYSWPWDLNISNGALKDVNNGAARWGYVRDELGKNITQGMTKEFPANVTGDYNIAITVFFNTGNYTDSSGRQYLDISDNPIVITFNDNRFDNYNWVLTNGAVAEWSEDKRTVTIKRVPGVNSDGSRDDKSFIVYKSDNTDKTIETVRNDLYNIHADVTGLSVNDGIDFTDPSTSECWEAYCGSTKIYSKTKTIDNCWGEHLNIVNDGDSSYKIVSLKDSNVLPELDDYSGLENIKFNSVNPVNPGAWNKILKWYSNNTVGGILSNNLGDVPLMKNCKGFTKFTINIDNSSYGFYGEDNWNGTDIEEITINTQYTISSPQRWFRGMSNLKTIKRSIVTGNTLFKAPTVTDMFGNCGQLENYESTLINWTPTGESEDVSRKYTYTNYFANNCYKLKKIPSCTPGDVIVCHGLSHMFNNCSSLTTIEPILDVRESVNTPENANCWFNNCSSLTSVKIKGLSNGNWYFNGQTVNGVTHGDLSSLNEESVVYLFRNLNSLKYDNPDMITKTCWNSFESWDIPNNEPYAADMKTQLQFVPTKMNSGDVIAELNSPTPLSYDGVQLKTFQEAGFSGLKIDVIIDGKTHLYIEGGSSASVDIPKGTTSIKLVLENPGTFTADYDLNMLPKWSTQNSVVKSAALYCPSSWRPYITDAMISAANQWGWTVHIDD